MMQREEINYEAATEAGGGFATNNNNNNNIDDGSSAPPPNYPTYNTQPGGEGGDSHDNTVIHGSGSVMVDYMLSNPHNHNHNPDLINNNNGYQQQKQQELLLVGQDQDHPNNSSSINNIGDRTLLSFADVMQFADFGPKLALNHHHHRQNINNNNGDHQEPEDDTGIDDNNDDDPVYFLKFPVLSNTHHMHMHMNMNMHTVPFPAAHHNDTHTPNRSQDADPLEGFRDRDQYGNGYDHHHHQQQINAAAAAAAAGVVLSTPTAGTSANNLINNYTNPLQIEFLGDNATNNDDNLIPITMEGTATAAAGVEGTILMGHNNNNNNNNKSSSSSSKRKRPRSIKTNEEVESQRMTHIAVERNRRKQMNEHLRVLRSLMPSSYVQRGDQASIIGGAIEFVRELEQLLQCLESQKRRRLYGDQPVHAPSTASASASASTSAAVGLLQPQYPPMPIPMPMGSNPADDDQLRLLDHHLDPGLLREETAESKSCFADVEVKVLGFDALIKILSRRRHGQLIKAIAALEDLHFTILHTNITTIEQTVLYSFNVKVANEARFTAEDIATSVQQIFTFIHANTNII